MIINKNYYGLPITERATVAYCLCVCMDRVTEYNSEISDEIDAYQCDEKEKHGIMAYLGNITVI